jgi:fatty-acid desaturase
MLTSSIRGVQIYLIIATVASVGYLVFGRSTDLLFWVIVLLGYFVYGCLGVVVMLHRKLTHQSYQTNIWIERLFSLFGALAGTGSPLAWVVIHLNHHKYSDKPGDPHSPKIDGLKIFALNYKIDDNMKWRVRELLTDRYQQFLHRYYFGVLIVWGVLLYSIGGMYLLIAGHILPATITAAMSNVVNTVGHKRNWIGAFRRYNLNDDSVNNWIFAIPSWGESWHNNHHRYPKRYRLGERWWEIDISGMIIKMIKMR